jgi:hypothetical protein
MRDVREDVTRLLVALEELDTLSALSKEGNGR